MAYRITIREIRTALNRISKTTGNTYHMDITNGRYRLATEDGTRWLTPQITRRQMYETLTGIGIFLEESKDAREEANNI